jgi:hypothetical protein
MWQLVLGLGSCSAPLQCKQTMMLMLFGLCFANSDTFAGMSSAFYAVGLSR